MMHKVGEVDKKELNLQKLEDRELATFAVHLNTKKQSNINN